MTSIFSNIGQTPKVQENKAPAQQNEAVASTKINKSPVGVANPPQDIYKPSLSKDVQDRVKTHENNLIPGKTNNSKIKNPINSNIMAASSLQGNNRSFAGSVIRTLLLLGGVVGGGYLLVRKIKTSRISDVGITTLDGVKKALDNLATTARKRKVASKDLKNVTVRVINEEPKNIREVLGDVYKITRETRNVDGQTPQFFVRLGQESKEAATKITEALKNEGAGINSLPDAILKKIDYINLRYSIKTSNANDTYLKTIVSDLKTGKAKEVADQSKAVEFVKALFSSS